jgi:hypothetical protein
MRGHSRLLVGIVSVVLVPTLAWALLWRVDYPARYSPRYQPWQVASARDCEAMAVSLLYFNFKRGLPLFGNTSASRPCDWPKYGLHLGTLTTAQFMAAYKGPRRPDSVYIEHMALSRPTYSLLRLRAAVQVAHLYGDLGGYGYVCHLLRAPSGWRLQGCRRIWVS